MVAAARVGWDPGSGEGNGVQGVLIFIFEGDDLVCEKVHFDHATILNQLGYFSARDRSDRRVLLYRPIHKGNREASEG
jgi:hypothetical protein